MNPNATRVIGASALALLFCGCAAPAPTLELDVGEAVMSETGNVTVATLPPWIVGGRAITRFELSYESSPRDDFDVTGYRLTVHGADGVSESERVDGPQMLYTSDARDPLRFAFELGAEDLESAELVTTTWTRSLEIRPTVHFDSRAVEAFMRGIAPASLRFELTMTAEPIAVPLEPMLGTDDEAHDLQRWTYPIVGFPRDVIDAPFTAVNRGLFGDGWTSSSGRETERRRAGGRIVGTTAFWSGFAYGAFHGLGAAGPHLAKKLVYAFGYGLWDGVVFGGVALGAILGYVVAVVPTQVALLRSPYDDTYFFKSKRAPIVLAGNWTDESIAAFERDERSLAYFPNWRFGVCGEHRVAPTADAPTVTVWVVRSLELRELAAAPPTE